MIDFEELEATRNGQDELLHEAPLFLVVQEFNVVRAAPNLRAAALGVKYQGDCVVAIARRGPWLRLALGEQDTETWMVEVGDPLGKPDERLLERAPAAATEYLRLGWRLAGTQSLVQHHLLHMSKKEISRAPANGPVQIGAFAFGLEARHSPVSSWLPGGAYNLSTWLDQRWSVYAMRPFRKGELVERCEVISLRTEMAFGQKDREMTAFDLALFWQQRHRDHPPVAVFPAGFALLYRLVPASNCCAVLRASWSPDGSALLLRAPQDLEMGVELCLSIDLRNILQAGCLGLETGPPELSRANKPVAVKPRGQKTAAFSQATVCMGFMQKVLRADIFLRAGMVCVGHSATHGRGVFALGKMRRNSVVEICPTLEVGEVGHFAMLDFVMKFRKGDRVDIVCALGCGMFYNHSDKPNVKWRCVPSVGSGLIVMTALCDIQEGEELFISYGENYWDMGHAGVRPAARTPAYGNTNPYFIAGSWNNYVPAAMSSLGDGLWGHAMTLGQSGQESFQILLRGDWEAAIYPSVQDANPYVEHKLQGPDGGGHGVNWTIGAHPKDVRRQGRVYDIVLSVDSRAVATSVTWRCRSNRQPGAPL